MLLLHLVSKTRTAERVAYKSAYPLGVHNVTLPNLHATVKIADVSLGHLELPVKAEWAHLVALLTDQDKKLLFTGA